MLVNPGVDPLVAQGVSGWVGDDLVKRVRRRGREAGLKGNYGGWIRIGAKSVQGWIGVTIWALNKIKKLNYPQELLDVATTPQDHRPALNIGDFLEVAAGLLSPTRPIWYSERE